MSTEVPRNSGTGAPIPTRGSEGRLSRFLRRIFIDEPEQLEQPQPGLEDFVGKLQKITNDHLTTQRQQELERKNAEAARIVAVATREAEAAQQQLIVETARRAIERKVYEVLQDFQITERLRHIQKEVWEGRGIIRSIPQEDRRAYDKRSGGDSFHAMGGLELIHEYPSTRVVYENIGGSDGAWEKYIPSPGVIKLSIIVTDVKHDSGESETALGISSDGTHSRKFETTIPITAEDSVALLDQALLAESANRIDRGFLPNRLEIEASGRIQLMKVQRETRSHIDLGFHM